MHSDGIGGGPLPNVRKKKPDTTHQEGAHGEKGMKGGGDS